MLQTILSWLSGGIVGQIGRQLNEAYQARLKAQNDRERIEADKEIERLRALKSALAEDRATRVAKLAYWTGRAPLFLAEMAAALYFSAVMIDSAFPMEWLTPLELPRWFQPHYGWALASIFGLSIVARRWR